MAYFLIDAGGNAPWRYAADTAADALNHFLDEIGGDFGQTGFTEIWRGDATTQDITVIEVQAEAAHGGWPDESQVIKRTYFREQGPDDLA